MRKISLNYQNVVLSKILHLKYNIIFMKKWWSKWKYNFYEIIIYRLSIKIIKYVYNFCFYFIASVLLNVCFKGTVTLKAVYLLSLNFAIRGLRFRSMLYGLLITICETGSGRIFSPLGLSHCWGLLVQERSEGISLRPSIIHSSIKLIVAITCEQQPSAL